MDIGVAISLAQIFPALSTAALAFRFFAFDLKFSAEGGSLIPHSEFRINQIIPLTQLQNTNGDCHAAP